MYVRKKHTTVYLQNKMPVGKNHLGLDTGSVNYEFIALFIPTTDNYYLLVS